LNLEDALSAGLGDVFTADPDFRHLTALPSDPVSSILQKRKSLVGAMLTRIESYSTATMPAKFNSNSVQSQPAENWSANRKGGQWS